MIYLDSSALLKLVNDEPESLALEEWVSARAGTPVVSSELAKLEVLRGCRRVNERSLPAARVLLAGLNLIPLTSDLVEAAAVAGEPLLRTLDAIHLVSAASIRPDLSAFIVYDRRLHTAAADAGLQPLSPGSGDG